MKSSSVNILELSLRDGIQNTSQNFSVADRFYMFKKLLNAGVENIEVGSFVSPKSMPQMKLTKALVRKINKELKISSDKKLFALVPNEHGFYTALDLGIKHISVMSSVTETFSQKNINGSIKESIKRIKNITLLARKNKIKVYGYLSMAFGCPYEGRVSQKKVVRILREMMEYDLENVAISDTIGVASPLQIESLVELVSKYISVSKLRLHCHNTRGMALTNILKGFELGIRKFDGSVGGLGGCPYALGSSGNVATEDLIILLKSMNVQSKIDVSKLTKLARWLHKRKKVVLSSNISRLSKDFNLYKFKKHN